MQQISMLTGTRQKDVSVNRRSKVCTLQGKKGKYNIANKKLNKSRLVEKISKFFLTRGTSVFFYLLVFRSTPSLLRCTALKSVRFPAKLH